MELSIFELEKKIIFSDEFVNVLVIENQKLFVDIVSRFYQLFNGEEISTPFVLTENNKFVALKNEFLIVDNPFMLSYVNKAVCTKLQKFILDKMQQTDEAEEIELLIEKIKMKFGDIFLDLDIELEYNESVGCADFLKILAPKIDFVDYDNLLNTYKNLLNILSQIKLYKFVIFVGIRRYLNKNQIVELYKLAKVYGVNLLVIESENFELLPYENKLVVDNDLYEQNVY